MNAPTRIACLVSSAAVLVLGTAVPALADGPASSAWPDAEPRSALDVLILFGGGTLGLIVLISLFALLTARTNFVPPPPGTEVEKASDTTPDRR